MRLIASFNLKSMHYIAKKCYHSTKDIALGILVVDKNNLVFISSTCGEHFHDYYYWWIENIPFQFHLCLWLNFFIEWLTWSKNISLTVLKQSLKKIVSLYMRFEISIFCRESSCLIDEFQFFSVVCDVKYDIISLYSSVIGRDVG